MKKNYIAVITVAIFIHILCIHWGHRLNPLLKRLEIATPHYFASARKVPRIALMRETLNRGGYRFRKPENLGRL